MIKYGALFVSLLIAGLVFAGGVEKGSLPLVIIPAVWMAIGGFIICISAKGD